MSDYICMTCGVQYDATDIPPERCIICEDERQYINQKGQKWTTSLSPVIFLSLTII